MAGWSAQRTRCNTGQFRRLEERKSTIRTAYLRKSQRKLQVKSEKKSFGFAGGPVTQTGVNIGASPDDGSCRMGLRARSLLPARLGNHVDISLSIEQK